MSEKTAKSKVDLENIKYEWSHKDHSYWFKYVGNYVWKVFDSDDKDIARIANDKGIRSIHPDTEISIRNNIIEEFTEFQMYPEYIMQFPLSDDEIDSITNVKSYEIILIGCCVLASRQRSESTEIGFQKAKRCIEWLRGTDFYTAPGSTKYHDAEESGLLKHTLRVFNHMLDLYKLEKFIIVNIEDAILVALTHDWCKIGLYEVSERNVKDKNTGAWYQEPFYKINEHKPFPFGHGVNSMFVAQRFFHLPLNRH